MLASFIQLLRSTLSNPNEFVTVRQEFDILRQYAEISSSDTTTGFRWNLSAARRPDASGSPSSWCSPSWKMPSSTGWSCGRGTA